MSRDNLELGNCPPLSQLHVINEQNTVINSPQNEEQHTIVNVFSKDDSEKIDKLVQTGSSTTTFKKVVLFSQKSFTKSKEASTNPITGTECEDPVKKETKKNCKPIEVFVCPEKIGNKSMETRKSFKNNSNAKGLDMARKKLEAELKAAEEIAKIKETVIEKRLALELASLEDSFDSPPIKKTPPTSETPLNDKKAFDDMQKRIVPVYQDNVMQEREMCYDYSYNRPLPTRSSFLGTSCYPKQQPPLAGKLLKTDSTSSILTSFRHLNLTDKKFNMDKKFYGFNDSRTPSPTNLPAIKDYRCVDSGCKLAKRHTEYHQKQPGSCKQPNKAQMIWRSAVTKIKNKIKNKPPPQ